MTSYRVNRREFSALSVGAAAFGLARPAIAQDQLQVSSVNYPLAYFAERLAGDLAEVSFPVPADVDPSFWRPGISDISAFQAADVILLNGASFASWTRRVSLPRSRLVNTSAAFDDAFIATETVTHSHGDGGEHSHTGTASYVWLDFNQAAQQAVAVAAALTRRASGAEQDIANALGALMEDILALDAEAAAIGEMADGIVTITSHPRYQYFARAYGLEIRELDWDPQAEPSEDQWQAVEALIAEAQAGVFIWEAQPTPAALDRMASLGVINAVFPPLANRPETGDFLTGMQASLSQLHEAFAGASAE